MWTVRISSQIWFIFFQIPFWTIAFGIWCRWWFLYPGHRHWQESPECLSFQSSGSTFLRTLLWSTTHRQWFSGTLVRNFLSDSVSGRYDMSWNSWEEFLSSLAREQVANSIDCSRFFTTSTFTPPKCTLPTLTPSPLSSRPFTARLACKTNRSIAPNRREAAALKWASAVSAEGEATPCKEIASAIASIKIFNGVRTFKDRLCCREGNRREEDREDSGCSRQLHLFAGIQYEDLSRWF